MNLQACTRFLAIEGWYSYIVGRRFSFPTRPAHLLVGLVCVACSVDGQLSGAENEQPGTSATESEEQSHWAFTPLGQVRIPQVAEPAWAATPIDRFIRAEHEARGLASTGQADPLSLLRRLRFDLTGLPPTREEIAAIRANSSAEAFSSLVDQLLDAPGFGEHWGRYWLDIVRYTDSFGSTKNEIFPLAWKYRNYVIDSFAADKPFDVFLREQIAGDLLPREEVNDPGAALTATGFLTLGCRNLNEMDPAAYRAEEVAEQIDTFGRSMMGLTLGCARCHDHKTAPIPASDYYALAGVFYSTQPHSGFGRFPPGISTKRRYDLLLALDESPEYPQEFTRDVRMSRELLEVLAGQVFELQNLKRELEDADPYDAVAIDKVQKKWRQKAQLIRR